MYVKTICLVLVAATVAVHSAPIETLRLKFKISARDLPDKDNIGKGDPYLEIYSTEDNKKDEIKLGRTATLTDTANPDWGDVFEFDFVRSKRQRFIIKVYDHDNLREDDKLGLAYIDVADFVDKGQQINANLNKKGYVILETVNPVVTPSPIAAVAPASPAVQVAPLAQVTPTGQAVYSTATPMKLRFKLSAKDLPDKDKVGATDPYVDIYFTEGASTKQTKVGSTAVINDNNNPSWGETFEFQYDPTKSQKWFFEVRDSDYGGDSDGVGKVWVEVMDYVAKGQKQTVNLSKKGTLTIESIDPVVAVAPAVQPVQIVQPAVIPLVNPAVQPIVVTHPVAVVAPAVPVQTPSPVQQLKFTLSARGLEDRDVLGTSDPYVKVYVKQGSDPEILLGNTKKYEDQENADWPDIFEFHYNPATNPKFHFLVLDEDANRSDEELGNVWLDVSEYVKNGQKQTLSLKKGTLTISKAN